MCEGGEGVACLPHGELGPASSSQNEKKMQLTQQETNKVKERDNQHTVDLREWRGEIAKQKQVRKNKLCITAWLMHACVSIETGGRFQSKSRRTGAVLFPGPAYS